MDDAALANILRGAKRISWVPSVMAKRSKFQVGQIGIKLMFPVPVDRFSMLVIILEGLKEETRPWLLHGNSMEHKSSK